MIQAMGCDFIHLTVGMTCEARLGLKPALWFLSMFKTGGVGMTCEARLGLKLSVLNMHLLSGCTSE